MLTNMNHHFRMLARRAPGRWRRYDPRRWPLFAEAFATLGLSSVAIRLLPFRYVVKLACHDRSHRFHSAEVPSIVRAIEALARRVPWRTVCFQKGLALQLMLRRRGISSVLHYGVGRGEANELAAHVWISVAGKTVIGGDVQNRFHCLATYPALD